MGHKWPKNQKIKNLSDESQETIFCSKLANFGVLGAKIEEEDTILVIFQKSQLKLRYALTHLRGQGGGSSLKNRLFSVLTYFVANFMCFQMLFTESKNFAPLAQNWA